MSMKETERNNTERIDVNFSHFSLFISGYHRSQ
jgi:hypothetical protein